jgi:hypothetical protein
VKQTASSSKADPIEKEIEQALRPGAFIRDGECFAFVSGLDQVAAAINQIIATEPSRAVSLYETFLAGCHAKADELDDSSGSFGQFARDVICGWIKARQTSGADPHRTASILLGWMDDDPYAFCYEIEKDAAAAFDKTGLAAFEKQIRAHFEAASMAPASWEYRRASEILRAIYCVQRDIQAYSALAEQTGLKPEDCLAIAKLLVAEQPGEALIWVERGRALDREKQFRSTAGYDLGKLHRELLTKLGRQNEALEVAWAEFQRHPSKFTYDELVKFVPEAECGGWHEKALNAASGADLHSLLGLFVETKEIGRLAELVGSSSDGALESVSHYAIEPAAKRLEASHPDLAARLWRAQGMRIVDAKKSKYYDAALSNFERARDCYQRAGLGVEWEKTVRRVCDLHFRKTGFINGFRALAAGAKRTDRRSFLERAKARWGKRHGGGDS